MDVSVIIVNYNVKHFLEQCLRSVLQAIQGIEAEVIVVDNASKDNSIDYLQERFNKVQFIANKENAGFAKACNQGWKMAQGRFVLFLNPDTLIPEDCLQRCLQFMHSHPQAGALGVRMIDGSGRFLKESKRAFPSPWISLFKLSGLARLFPHSSLFARYHLGHLAEQETHEVDVLAGAFMLLRNEVLEKTQGFDETFFMYGEDVDLSYRVKKVPLENGQGFYTNYYYPGTSIIHFKGESTRKGSMNYVRMFYTAMSLFVRKHYGGSKAGLFNLCIHLAIWLRAALSATGRFIRRIGLPLIDAGLILLSFWIMKGFWSQYIKTDTRYDFRLIWIAFPSFTLVYLLAAYYAGLYDRWYKRSELIQSTLVATVVVLAVYSLLPEQYRFSRGIILFGAILAFFFISILRRFLVNAGVLSGVRPLSNHASTVIVASVAEFNEIDKLMRNAGKEQQLLGRIAVAAGETGVLATWPAVHELHKTLPFREIIVAGGSLSVKEIIAALPQLPGHCRIKIHLSDTASIVGSHSKDSSGEALSSENGYRVQNPHNLRLKRLIDVAVAVLGLVTFPIHLFFIKKPFHFIANCVAVLLARKTWIGYAQAEPHLPPLRKPVLASNGVAPAANAVLPAESRQMLDYWYARDYEPAADLRQILASYRMLGA